MTRWSIAMTAAGVVVGAALFAQPAADGRCFELRTYTVTPGKMDILNRRFEDHSIRLFRKHGIDVIAFWTPADRPNTLVYMLAHKSCEAAPSGWKAFFDDPEWIAARDASEKDGPLVSKVEKTFMRPTSYSPLK